MLPPVPRFGVALALLLLPGCFNPTGATSTGSTGPTPGDTSDTTGDATATSTSTGNTTPPTTLPSMTDPTTESVTTAEPITTTAPPPPGCGNGVMEVGEECDDGDNDNTDDCLDSCTLAVCGDGFVHAKLEGCDDGLDNADDAPCTLGCQPNFCGDTLLCPACGEQCEATTNCNPDCTFKQRFVFVTSKLVKASLIGGLSGADELCAQAAGVNDLLVGRKLVAWLSTSEVSAADRLDKSPVPYMRLDDQVVADNYEDFLDVMTTKQAPIDVNENGHAVVEGFAAWTGTLANGKMSDPSEMCGDWESGAGNGRTGTITSTDATWSHDGTLTCDELARLYCIQTLK